MKTKILSAILSAIILLTSAAILVGCGGEKAPAAKIETVTEVATDEQGSTQIVEETRVIEETTATNLKSENSESSETKSNDSSASKNNTNSANVKGNSNSSKTVNKTTTNNTNSNKSSAKVTGGSTKSNSTPAKSVVVTSVSLSKSSLGVTVGKSASFTVKVNPNNASNKDYVASTNNGNAKVSCSGSTVTVKGISKGSCTVTVKSNNGKTAKCSVTVKAKASSTPAKVTDDTVLSLSELHTDKSMKKICDKINQYFINKGMHRDSSWNKNNSGWFFIQTHQDWKEQSINSYVKEACEFFDVSLWSKSVLGENYYDDGETSYTYYVNYSDCTFNCYYEKVSDGSYHIYFCV